MMQLEVVRRYLDLHLDDIEPNRFAMYLNVLARFRYMPKSSVYPVWRQKILDILPSLAADEMSTITNALGRLLYFPDQRFVDTLIRAASRITEWKPQLLANTLYGICRMEGKVSSEDLSHFARIARSQLSDFNAQDLAMTISALGRLGCHPGVEIFDAMRGRMKEISHEFSSEGLSMSLMGWGLVGYHPGEEFLGDYYTWLMRHTKTIKGSDLVEALAGLTRIQAPPPQALVDWSLKVLMRGQMERLKAGELGVLLHWITTFKLDPGEDFCNFAIRCMLKRWNDLTPTAMATILTGLGRLDAAVPLEVLDKMRDMILYQLKGFNSQEISNILTAISRLRYDPGQAFFGAISQLVGERMDQFSIQGVTNILNGLAKAGYDPPKRFWTKLCSSLSRFEDDFNLFEACAFLWSLVALNSRRSWEVVPPLVHYARTRGEEALAEGQVDMDCARQLKQVMLAVKIKGDDVLSSEQMAGFQEVVNKVWELYVRQKDEQKLFVKTSAFQKSVTAVLAELGLSYEEEYDDGVFIYDAVIWPRPDAPPSVLPVVFEVDGPSHYLVNDPTACVGDTRFKVSKTQ